MIWYVTHRLSMDTGNNVVLMSKPFHQTFPVPYSNENHSMNYFLTPS